MENQTLKSGDTIVVSWTFDKSGKQVFKMICMFKRRTVLELEKEIE